VELLPTGMGPSIHANVFARYERSVLEIEHRVDDVRNFTHPSEGMKLCQGPWHDFFKNERLPLQELEHITFAR
jgi:hypothetical protein